MSSNLSEVVRALRAENEQICGRIADLKCEIEVAEKKLAKATAERDAIRAQCVDGR